MQWEMVRPLIGAWEKTCPYQSNLLLTIRELQELKQSLAIKNKNGNKLIHG